MSSTFLIEFPDRIDPKDMIGMLNGFTAAQGLRGASCLEMSRSKFNMAKETMFIHLDRVRTLSMVRSPDGEKLQIMKFEVWVDPIEYAIAEFIANSLPTKAPF